METFATSKARDRRFGDPVLGEVEFGRVVAERARSLCVLASTRVPTSCCSYPDTDGYEQPKGGRSPRGHHRFRLTVPLRGQVRAA
jgi:hypothetical protein